MSTRRAWSLDEMWPSGEHGRLTKQGCRMGMGARWTWAPVETEQRSKCECQASMGVGRSTSIMWAWCRSKRSAGRNAGWYRLVFGQASFLDGLLSPMGSGCWGGCPNHIFGIAIVNWKADRLISCCSGDRRQFEGWRRVRPAFLWSHCYFVIAFASI